MKRTDLVCLIVLDGWGIRSMRHGNAVMNANKPCFDYWLSNHEASILDTSGEAVGLVEGQMGNSEVGHLNLGAGFVVYQEISRIDKSIKDDKFKQIEELQKSLTRVKAEKGKVHLVGLMSPGGVHSHVRHLYALLEICRNQQLNPILHVITDGRDTPPKSALDYVTGLENYLLETGCGRIGTISGRYYSMDRDNRWERIKLAYDAMVEGSGPSFANAKQAIQASYDSGVTDEFMRPCIIASVEGRVSENDLLIFFNFRADRMRQIVSSFSEKGFDKFERKRFINASVCTFTEYESGLHVNVLFPQVQVDHPLARVLAENGMSQLHAAETEKYPHVTYFFNGRREEPFQGEDRMLVPSPKIATYDLKPEMSAYELKSAVIEKMKSKKYNFVLVNFANPDMVGHTGFFDAAKKAVETADACAGALVDEVLKQGGVALVTADHGNAERMIDEFTGNPHTAHTTGPVHLIAVHKEYVGLRPRGILADIAPTVLELLGLDAASEMTGRSLLAKEL